MKIKIRRGVFETNSSSVHSLVMCTDDDYNKWKRGEILYDKWANKLVTLEEAKKEEDYLDEEEFNSRFLDYDHFYSSQYIEYETFEQTFKTPGGEIVYGFGYYGQDC